MKERSRQEQLAALLGDLGEVFPYVDHADLKHLAPGWYGRIKNGHAKGVWALADGTVFFGHDVPTAAITIAKIADA